MPYTIEDFRRDVEPYYTEMLINTVSPDKLLSKFSTQQIEAYLKQANRRASATKAKKKRKKA